MYEKILFYNKNETICLWTLKQFEFFKKIKKSLDNHKLLTKLCLCGRVKVVHISNRRSMLLNNTRIHI